MQSLTRSSIIVAVLFCLFSMWSFLGPGNSWGERRVYAAPSDGAAGQETVVGTAANGTTIPVPAGAFRYVLGYHASLVAPAGAAITGTPVMTTKWSLNGSPAQMKYAGTVSNGNITTWNHAANLEASPGSDIVCTVSDAPLGSILTAAIYNDDPHMVQNSGGIGNSCERGRVGLGCRLVRSQCASTLGGKHRVHYCISQYRLKEEW
jgi:hypothetical protein